MSYEYIFTDSLSHHGIKGQRWGIRRYRNEDGSLTAAGQKRYGKRYERRQKQIESNILDSDSHKRYADEDERLLKRTLKSDKEINKVYKQMYGEDDPEDNGYKSKKEAVKSSIESSIKWNRDMAKSYKERADIIKNTPINKLTRDEMKKVTKGLNRTAFMLNTMGAVTVGALIKKQGGKIDKDTVKALAGMDLLFTAGAVATNAMVREAVSDRREKKILENLKKN